MIKAVLFDMDGTLLDTEKYLIDYLKQAVEELGFSATYEQIYGFRSLSPVDSDIYGKSVFGNGYNHQYARDRRRQLMSEHLETHELELKPFVKEILSYLKSRGIMTAVVTATNEKTAVEYLNETGISDYMDRIVSTSMVEKGKPNPDVYIYACEQIGLSPSECLAVEDSPNGVRSAQRAGCKVAMVPDLTEADEEMKDITDYVFENLNGISTIM